MTRKTLLIAAVLCLMTDAAHAQSKPSILVQRKDLELTSPKDAQRLYDRIFDAASKLCGGGPLVTFFPFPDANFIDCREKTLDAALAQSHAPLVVALRQAHKVATQPDVQRSAP